MKLKLIFIFFLLSLGCGIKGPPLPPVDTMERTNNASLEEKPAAIAVSSDITTQKAKKK